MELLPAEYAWLQPVLIASLVVFVVDLIGNYIAFGNRIINALVTAIIFGLIFTALVYLKIGGVSMTVNLPS